MPRLQNKENDENISSVSIEISNKLPNNSNKLVNTDFLKVRLKKPNSNTSLANNQTINNLKTIKKTQQNNVIINNEKIESIKNSIDSNDISLTTKYRPIKRKQIAPEKFSSTSSSSDLTNVVVKTEAQIPVRRLSTGSDKSFKTTDETSTVIEEHLKEKNALIEEEKMDTSNENNENVNNNVENNEPNKPKEINDNENNNDINKSSPTREPSVPSNISSDEERLVIDDEKVKNSDSNESDKELNRNKPEDVTLNENKEN